MNAWVTTNHIGLRLLPSVWALYFMQTLSFMQYYPYHSRPHRKHLVLKVLGDQRIGSKRDTGIPRFISGNCTWFSSCAECNGHVGSVYAAMAVPQGGTMLKSLVKGMVVRTRSDK